MDTAQLKHFKEKLEHEKARLFQELTELGRINPSNPEDWETTYSNLKSTYGAEETSAEADPLDQATLLEEYETRVATEGPIEAQYLYVNRALKRIEDGTYGHCTKGDAPHEIEHARLEASPIATTCIEHMKQ